MMWRKLLGVALIAVAGNAWADDNGGVVVRDAWVGESVPGQTTASVQMSVTSTARSAKLVGIDSPASESAEMQRPWPSGGKIRMVKVSKVRLPRGRPVEFGDRSISMMLLGLKEPLKQGDHVPVNLNVYLANGDKVTVEVQAEVRPLDLSYMHYKQGEVQDH